MKESIGSHHEATPRSIELEKKIASRKSKKSPLSAEEWNDIYQGNFGYVLHRVEQLPAAERNDFIEKLQDAIDDKSEFFADRSELADEQNDEQLADVCLNNTNELTKFYKEISSYYRPEIEDRSTLEKIRSKINTFIGKDIL